MTLRYQQVVGREFLYGVRDCYALVTDVYRDSFGITLTNYARPSDWSSDQRSLIRRLYENDGFKMLTEWKVTDLRPGDILCMAVGASEPNHLAVFIGNNEVVHHLWGRLSSVDPYRDFFRNTTCFVLRHPEVPDLTPVLPVTDVRSLLSARYDLQASE